ncbi:phosphotransferase [Streptomyces sp. MBT62]|uniref:phosphotransferase n=1 Tax=Streptomyces sp. MBT62 TaxID=2800410 RepID=UPI00190BD604|nr:phosphotransferase [Streptomyces sp. MBT62]MBK3566957.1 phosphotransferase [Streptomyces sp. MBT62]
MGKLIGSGRTADVYEIDDAWVLRRNREDWGDAAAEGAVMEHVRAYGYPVPRVRIRPGDSPASRTDLVMERLTGPTMVEALTAGAIDAREAGTVLAALLRRLHAIPGRRPGTRVLHLDLHPENVLLTPAGPHVIDWGTTEDGDPGLDWGLSAIILAQVAVDDLPIAGPAREVLAALLADPADLTEAGLAEARRRRAANPTMTAHEVELLGTAEELIRSLAFPREP